MLSLKTGTHFVASLFLWLANLPQSQTNYSRYGIPLAVITAVIFGIFPPANRAVYADGGNAAFMVLAATLMRGICLALFCALTGNKLFQTRENNRKALIGGFFQIAAVVFLYASFVYIPGPLAIIILFTHTLMQLLFMAWRGEIRLDVATVATTLIALVGLTFVLNVWDTNDRADPLGVGLAFAAALCTVARFYIYHHLTRATHPIVIGAESFLVAIGFALLIPFVAPVHPPHSLNGWGWVTLACVSTTLGTFGMFYGISLLGSFRYSLYLKVEPIFTALFSTWFLGEILKIQQYGGIFLTIASLIAYQIYERSRLKRVL